MRTHLDTLSRKELFDLVLDKETASIIRDFGNTCEEITRYISEKIHGALHPFDSYKNADLSSIGKEPIYFYSTDEEGLLDLMRDTGIKKGTLENIDDGILFRKIFMAMRNNGKPFALLSLETMSDGGKTVEHLIEEDFIRIVYGTDDSDNKAPVLAVARDSLLERLYDRGYGGHPLRPRRLFRILADSLKN